MVLRTKNVLALGDHTWRFNNFTNYFWRTTTIFMDDCIAVYRPCIIYNNGSENKFDCTTDIEVFDKFGMRCGVDENVRKGVMYTYYISRKAFESVSGVYSSYDLETFIEENNPEFTIDTITY